MTNNTKHNTKHNIGMTLGVIGLVLVWLVVVTLSWPAFIAFIVGVYLVAGGLSLVDRSKADR
jgi:uncharacterized membrane protein